MIPESLLKNHHPLCILFLVANAEPTKLFESKNDEAMAMVTRATVALLLSITMYDNSTFLRSMK
jgi:hypothetical protein